MSIQEAIQQATSRDPVNITVYGNPVVDLICPAGPHARDVSNVKALKKIGDILQDGTLEFRPDTYIVSYLPEAVCLFGPLNPNGHQPTYAVGRKHRVPFAI